MIKKLFLWFGAISPVLYAVLGALVTSEIHISGIFAWIFVSITFLMAIITILLVSQHCWEKVRN